MKLWGRRQRKVPSFAAGGVVPSGWQKPVRPSASHQRPRGLPPKSQPELHVHVHVDGNEIEQQLLRRVTREQSGGGGIG